MLNQNNHVLCLTIMWIQGSWIPLLQDAQYGGAWQSSTGYVPLALGTFDAFKAVYKSGFVTCDVNARSAYHWNECSTQASFELLKNGQRVVMTNYYNTLPPTCILPKTPTGDIVCLNSIQIVAGDRLTPTWEEVTNQHTVGDNAGTITIDLYGWTDVCATHPFFKCSCKLATQKRKH